VLFSVEVVFPEGAQRVICKVVVLAVDVFELVWAWLTFLHFKSRGVRLFVGLIAPGHVPVVLKLVGAATFLTLGAMGATQESGVTPFPTVAALGDSRVHRCTSYSGNVLT